MTTKRWICIFLFLAAVCITWLLLSRNNHQGDTVIITQDGHILYTIDLSAVTEPYTLTIPYGRHFNTVSVSPHEIQVLEADCSNQVCVNHGILQKNGTPITCLPHHLTISWAESQVDG